MAGTSNKYWMLLLAASLMAFSCVKEKELASLDGEERVYDPVVRFGLETYQVTEPVTKTIYAGDDQQYQLNSVRYERINWNVKATAEDAHLDTVCVKAELDFTLNDKQSVDYRAVEIVGRTNRTGTIYSEADTAPASGDAKDNLYWSTSSKDRYFYATYPSPSVKKATLKNFDIDAATHTATVEGEIPDVQPYIHIRKTGTPGTPGSPACIEYLPDMNNAYMYAAAKVPGADAGFKKVPLRFKPLFSAVKLIITAREMGAEEYRLKKVVLRTDINTQDLYMRPDVDGPGTALAGKFKAGFKTDAKGTTGDFSLVGTPTDTLKKITIEIPETDRYLLGEDTLKLTFLALPVKQKYMTVDYTFERWDGAQWKEVRRTLALQNSAKIMRDAEWYELDAANKLYVRSRVPVLQYYFDVVIQGNLPRTWSEASPKPSGKDFYLADNFYAVISYRDSAGIKQPMRWKVTGYRENASSGAFSATPPAWLRLKGDDPWTQVFPFDMTDPGTFDAWDTPQGQGTKMRDELRDTQTNILLGYKHFDPFTYNYYPAGARNNDNDGAAGDKRKWFWSKHGSYFYKDPEGRFSYPAEGDKNLADSTGWVGQAGEAYAYDLSSHDIYGNLIVTRNGDLGTTANCYVVSGSGWYRFPVVYGNAIKNGSAKPAAYTGTGGPGLMGAFLDHKNNPIKDPWIPYTIQSVDVLWDDASHMVAQHATKTSRTDRSAFCQTIDGKQYIYFYVDDIAQGNAVIAAKDESGLIAWSWHIWAVPNPKESLKTIELQSNKTMLNPIPNDPNLLFFSQKDVVKREEMVLFNEPGFLDPKISKVKNIFWKTADLGQNELESSNVGPRYCDVEFTQYYRGKEVKKVVRRVLQSGVKDTCSDTPGFQWGRKDPMQAGYLLLEPLPTDTSVEKTGTTIQKPNTIFYGSNKNIPTGKRYDNLWNTLIDSVVTNDYADGRAGGSQDREVEKTIYDPSPAGFVIPNMLAYTGVNPYSPLDQTRVPKEYADDIAVDHLNSYKNNQYIDFYTDYDPGAPRLRLKDKKRTIRFFTRGRVNGSGSPGERVNKKGAYYWTSEPGIWDTGLFGRSFTLDGDKYVREDTVSYYAGQGLGIWPVAGVPTYMNPDGSGTPAFSTRFQSKWQRSHGNIVRPMMEEP